MAYSIPLRFVKISVGRSDNKQSDVAICATRIVALMSTEVYQARKTITAEKKAVTLINAAGIGKAKTAIFLDNGTVIASPLTVNRIMTLIDKASTIKEPNRNKRMTVYDVYDDDEEEDEEDELDDETE